MTNGTRRGWGVSVTPWPLLTPGKDPVPIVQEAGWAPGPVWTGAENLAPTGIRSPDRPARSQSLYRLSYPVHGQTSAVFNPLNAELNPICHLLALLKAHHIFHVSGLKVKNQTNEKNAYSLRASRNAIMRYRTRQCTVITRQVRIHPYYPHLTSRHWRDGC
jgi:hypothetical protein